MPEPVPAHPAATVVLLRDGRDGCEVLLVRRNARLSFHGGAWVFPGGRIDAADYRGGGDVLEAARRAAVREAHEEAGVTVVDDGLLLFSRWVTPEGLPKRFDTWFFASRAGAEEVQIDGGEIHDHQWLSPAAALAAQSAGTLELPPPTFVTLTQLSGLGGAAETLGRLAVRPFEMFEPHLHMTADGAVTLYAGDDAYESGDLDLPGARHRLWMRESGWRYERKTI